LEGGGLLSDQGIVSLKEATFSENESITRGVAWRALVGVLQVESAEFSGNRSDIGGGVYVRDGSSALRNILFRVTSPVGGA